MAYIVHMHVKPEFTYLLVIAIVLRYFQYQTQT